MVHLTTVANTGEAEIICSLLRTEGIECFHRNVDFAVGVWQGLPGGPQEVLVDETRLERARELLATSE